MPNTGQFYLLRIDGQADEAERLLEVTAVECNCLPCGWTFTAVPGQGLISVPGGAVLACPHCGNRQAVSLARFSEFIARVGGATRTASGDIERSSP
ncbi:hypothetical protein [Stenotrophomonas sp.]|uniref:hypothetical protein n=1 Tax=Stenotrophomonas sp. TaxID=69392 RepID=UPI0029B58945|nr:hypothetical protein [Stenotrophomonas sp.]MDX3935661.1 hypothetical protein [Stenotrophomonas sp.]